MDDRLRIYTDGSGINGHVGAAVVFTTPERTRSLYMGDEKTWTVFAAELQAHARFQPPTRAVSDRYHFSGRHRLLPVARSSWTTSLVPSLPPTRAASDHIVVTRNWAAVLVN